MVLLLLLLLFPCSAYSLNQDGVYLLEAKRNLHDPYGSLSNWNPQDSTPCNWRGVYCSSSSSDGGAAVISVDFSSMKLAGPFPSSLCLLPSLTFLSLSDNDINSTLPSSSLLPCSSLSHLDLSYNLLVGELPSSLSSLPKLTYLDLTGNNFTGDIPLSFAAFPVLRQISLVNNLLNSTIPAFFSNVSTLTQLNLSYNPFAPGVIPSEFGNLSKLQTLWLSQCNLIGNIPPELGKLTSLLNLDLSSNSLSGDIPASLSNLSAVEQIELYSNNLTGRFPAGFSKLKNIRRLDAAMNRLQGLLPADVFASPKLDSLHLYENQLNGEIPASISESLTLADLRLFSNNFSGGLPPDFGKKSPLVFVDLSENLLSGEIPASICDSGMLEQLLILDNYFSGRLPEGLNRCNKLTRVRLANNRFSGEVPAGLWGLPHLSLLELAGNSFSGDISPAISGANSLTKLLISNNHFTGSIPDELGSVYLLEEFSAANNKFTGPVPSTLGKLSSIAKLDLHNNSISGELPRDIKRWTKLTELNLAGNQLIGVIPPELGNLPVLNYLDLSNNELTGEIPSELENLKLNKFNLSNNQLTGSIPPLFSTRYRESFLGNPGLCDRLCPGTRDHHKQHNGFLWLIGSIFILAALVLIIGIVLFFCKYNRYKKEKIEIEKSRWTLTSFHKLGFSEYEILDCIDEDNVIGSGASGRVYKAVLSNGDAVAVKKLWNSSDRSDGFDAEVDTLGKIRHKNIVKLWCCCTHKDSKLLVYEYMTNGSLGDLLHSSKGGILDWPTRLKIALDAAEGLSYLHHDCVPPIVHRDIKSNNILLDAEFGAKVADFGVAKAVESKEKAMSIIAGSCGYIAPEYAYTLRVNEKSDIYSFGVVILELITGKRPIDGDMEDKDLIKWVSSTLQENGIDSVIDPKLANCFKEEIAKVLDIGLLCTSSLPINRPSMRNIVKMLIEVNPLNKPISEKKSGIKSPYYDEDISDHGSIV